MKLKLVSCLTKQCGIGRYTHELGSGLFNRGIDVEILRKDGGNESFIKGYPYRSLRQLRDYVAPFYLSTALSTLDSDIWHADYVDAALALFLAKKSKQKIVTTAHDAIPFLFSEGIQKLHYRYLLKQAAKISDAIIVVSQTSKDDLVKYSGIPPEKIYVIYNGINHQNFYPDPIKKRNDIFTIRYVGGLGAPHKNSHLLIEVAKLLAKEGKTFRMEIGGAYPENTELPKMAKAFGLSQITFSGFIPDSRLREFLADADAFLYPSAYEGFGFPPLEAMACGTPTVSSNGGCLEEVLKDGALLAKPDARLLADQMARIMFDDTLYSEMSKKAVAVAETYHWEKVVDQTLALYKFIL